MSSSSSTPQRTAEVPTSATTALVKLDAAGKKDWDVKSPHRVLREIRLIGLLPYRERHCRTLLRRRRTAPRQWRLHGCNQWLFRRTPRWRLAQRERPLIRCRLDHRERPMSPLLHPPLLLKHHGKCRYPSRRDACCSSIVCTLEQLPWPTGRLV